MADHIKAYGMDCKKTTIYFPLEISAWLDEIIKESGEPIPRNLAIIMLLKRCKKEGMRLT